MSDDQDPGFGFGLAFSAESRASLGLAADANVRVAARAGRMVLLECGQGDGPAVPWDRDLVLSGDVRSFPLADLLSLLHEEGKSGFLLFQFEGDEKAIYLSRGEVVFAESNLASDRLGASLLRSGRIDQAQLDRAESRFHPMTRFGKVVVELGILTPRELWNGVKGQVEEIVRGLFSYTAGWIHFWEGEVEPDNVVRLSLPTNRLIDEGLEKRDELLRFLARLEDGATRLLPGEHRRSPSSENERAILRSLEGATQFSVVCHHSGIEPRTAARTIQLLQLTGQVRIEHEQGDSGADFATADDDVVREAVAIHAKLIFELAAPLIALDGAADVSERLNRVMVESAERGLPLLEAIAFGQGATLDPVELEYHALRLPGDRVRHVDEALGEVVAYLEFELKNHPGIEDCSGFLEAVDPLRAMLIR